VADDREPEWIVHGIRVLHDDVVRIEEHDVETPEGRRYRFPLVRSPGFAKVVPIMSNGDVVLVRQYRYAVGGQTLEVPAGAIDPGEEPGETAWRELAEEALVTCDRSDLEPLGEFSTSPGRMDERGYVFLARNCRPDPTAVQHEPTLPVHLPLADAIALIGGEVLAATSALALLLAQRRLAGGDR
jgi:ADP-ribose pyrophosphatase